MKSITVLPQLCIAAALTLLAPSTLFAQQPAAETLQQRVAAPSATDSLPSVPSGTANSDLGTIGVVEAYPKPATITLSTSQQFFYTDNVFYVNEHSSPIGSPGYLGSYTASWVPFARPNWTPRISVQYNMIRYSSAASGDFDNENASFSSQYIFGDDRSWTWSSAVNLARFTDPHTGDHLFYEEVVYDNQISNVQQLIKNTPLFFITSYDLAYHQADPAIYDRLDNTLSFSCIYYPFRELSLGPYVRPGARTYFTNGTVAGLVQNNRDDFNLAVGFDVTWQPWEDVSFSADFSHVNDYSNNSALGYTDNTPGLSVTGTVKF
jgi:hypothetical protein